MLEVIFVRHGQTAWNVERRVMGMLPIGLTAEGRKQIQATAADLAGVPFAKILTSPAQRTRESAEIIAKKKRGVVIVDTPAFAEINYGDWIDRPFTDIEKTGELQTYFDSPSTYVIPGGERVTDAMQRVIAGVEAIRKHHAHGRIVVVTHADIVKFVLIHYLEFPLDHWQRFRIDNGTATVVRFGEHARARIVGVNLCSGWGRLLSDIQGEWETEKT